MAYTILEYTLGDRSNDGHGRTDHSFIKVNHTNAELLDAMNKFKAKTGCNWENWCRDYQQHRLTIDDTEAVKKYIGKAFDNFETDYDGEDEDGNRIEVLYLQTDSYVALLMAICRVELPDLDWSWYSPVTERAFFDGKGYGLFY